MAADLSPPQASGTLRPRMSDRTLAALAEGRLYLKDGTDHLQRHESDFAQEILDRHLRMAQKHAWKGGGGDEGSMIPRNSLWGRGEGDSTIPIVVSSVAPGEEGGHVAYLLETESVGGLLDYELAAKHERRLFHREGFRAGNLDRHPETRKLVCSVPVPGGGSNLAVIEPDGRDLREATEGDSFDDAPSWIPGEEFTVVFQSAGLARSREGQVSGLGPFAIERLDFRTGEMETLRSNPQVDFLQPHLDTEGNLYYIRRPYDGPRGPRPPWTSTVKDVLLFPVRLVRALLHFLDAFSRFFSQKPLLSAGGPQQEGPDRNQLWIHGRLLEMKNAEGDEGKSLAPSDWQLIRATSEGSETVLAKGVLAYDLAPDGTLAYTNGRHLTLLKDGRKEKVADLSLADTVKWV